MRPRSFPIVDTCLFQTSVSQSCSNLKVNTETLKTKKQTKKLYFSHGLSMSAVDQLHTLLSFGAGRGRGGLVSIKEVHINGKETQTEVFLFG